MNTREVPGLRVLQIEMFTDAKYTHKFYIPQVCTGVITVLLL